MYKINSESIGDVKKYVWHYRKDNKEFGPFTYEDIVEMARKGEIGPEDYLLKFGNRKFFKASEVQGLFDNIEQPETGQEEISEAQEEQAPVQEVQAVAVKEEPKEDVFAKFENRNVYSHTRRSREPYGSRIIIAAAVLLGLCLAVWVLTRLF